MKNPYIIPAAMVCATILAGIWMLKSPSEQPQKVMIVQPPQPPDISIHDAARTGNIEAVKQHLAAGTDVNKKIKGGWTPLHTAATWGHKEIIELLIASGADLNAKDEYGKTPLDWAIDLHDVLGDGQKGKFKETADLLRKHGGKTGEELVAEAK
jgi:ankyrin repeat protein